MRLVDLALQRLLQSLGVLEHTEFYCFEPPNLLGASTHEILYRSILDMDDPGTYDAILIWGDFIITKWYLEKMAAAMAGTRRMRREAVREALLRRVLLRDLPPESLGRVVLFGQNIFLDKQAIFRDEPYLGAFRKLLTHARVARLRDPVSAWCAAEITGQPPGRFAGVDPALLIGLIDPPQAPPTAGKNQPSSRVGIFLDRTNCSLLTRLTLSLALRLAGGLQPLWIPWFPPIRSPSILSRAIFGIRHSARPTTLMDYLDTVRGCRFIISDAYHLCLTAWAQGVPALSIGRGAQKFKSTVSDKKKEVFYLSHHLDELYVFCDSPLSNILRGRIRRAMALATDPNIGHEVRKRLMVMAEENFVTVQTALMDILRTQRPGQGRVQ